MRFWLVDLPALVVDVWWWLYRGLIVVVSFVTWGLAIWTLLRWALS
jgi:hypothetical protein